MVKKILMMAFAISIVAASCSKGITPYEAANGKAKCGRYVK